MATMMRHSLSSDNIQLALNELSTRTIIEVNPDAIRFSEEFSIDSMRGMHMTDVIERMADMINELHERVADLEAQVDIPERERAEEELGL